MNLRNLAFACSSGLLLSASFPSINQPLLAWIALVPLLLALKGQTLRNAFLLGGVCGLFFFSGTVNWVAHSVNVYGNVSFIPSLLVTLLLCIYLALYPALFAAGLAVFTRQQNRFLFLAAPALWTSLELARTGLFSGFPWALLGYSQYSMLPVIQIADITGVYGVSFLIVLVNSAIVQFVNDRTNPTPILAAFLVTGLVSGYGLLRLNVSDQGPAVRISVIQGNIDQDKKWDPVYQRETFSAYQRLTREALKEKPDLVIWPETSTPFYFGCRDRDDRQLTAELSAFVKSTRVPLLFGSPTYDAAKPHVLRNNAFLLSPDGAVAGEYCKIHLVPFGEYVPLKHMLFFVKKIVQTEGEFEPGREHTVMSIPVAGRNVPVSTVICYEIIFPDLVRRFVKSGASVITTITNDAWFGKTAAPYQHFSMAVFRAVENRVPVARAANTGISGFIDAKGRILSASDIFTEDRRTILIFPGRISTFYTAWGDIFSYVCLLTSLVFLAKSRTKT